MTEAREGDARKPARKVRYLRKPGPKKRWSKLHQVQAVERIKGHPDFKNDWGFPQDNSKVSHFFISSAAGKVVSLCHLFKQPPVWVVPATEKEGRKCEKCLKILDRRQSIAALRQEKKLRRSVDARIASFLVDPTLGPRLYGCPVCNTVYEGMAPSLFPCSEGGHPATLVVELARKDTWTKDKPA